MFKFTVLAILLGVCYAAPTADPVASPHPAPQPGPSPVASPDPAPAPLSDAQSPLGDSKSALALSEAHAPVASLETKSAIQAPVPVAAAGIAPGGISAGQPGHVHAPIEPESHPVIAAPAGTGVPSAKQLLIEAPLVKTPASTGKLTPLATPLITPISPLTYAAAPAILAPFPAWNGLNALPLSYSIEQHGYHITY